MPDGGLVHELPAEAGQACDKPCEGRPVFLAERAAAWQAHTRCSFTLLVNCEVAISAKLNHAFDSPVPIPLHTWLQEPITQQHTLLSLLGCTSEEAISGQKHAQKVVAVQGSTVTVVLTAVQRYRLCSLGLAAGAQVLGRHPHGSPLYRAAQPKHQLCTVTVLVLQVAPPAVTLSAVARPLSVFQGFAGGRPAKVLLDTGASDCLVSRKLAAGLQAVRAPQCKVQLADGLPVVLDRAVQLTLQLGAYRQRGLRCYVLPAAAVHDVILGESWLHAHQVVLQYDAEQGVTAHTMQGRRRVRVRQADCAAVPCMQAKIGPTLGSTQLLSARQMRQHVKQACSVTGVTQAGERAFLVLVQPAVQAKLLCSAAPAAADRPMTAECAQLHELLHEFADILTNELPAGVPLERAGAGEVIPEQPGTRPVYRPPYRLSPTEKAEVVRTVDELLAKGFIRPSTSPYGAPITFVAKKGDQSLRMCMDYRGLNKQTVSNKYPLPRIDEMLDRLQGAKVFSSLDLASGYHQLKLQDSDVPKTAFCTPDGLYEFLVLPFGLTNAPAVFQNAMDSIFRGLSAFVCVYMDDLLVFSRNHVEHMEHLRTVLGLLRKHRLYAKPKKCDWLKSELAFLGHIVGVDGIKVDPAKIQVVKDFPVPRNLKELQQFLGLANYFRRFVQGYSARAKPLVSLTRKSAAFVWSAECQAAFDSLKQYLMEAPVLAMPDMEKPWELVSDACGYAMGAVLLQLGRPVGFFCALFNKCRA